MGGRRSGGGADRRRRSRSPRGRPAHPPARRERRAQRPEVDPLFPGIRSLPAPAGGDRALPNRRGASRAGTVRRRGTRADRSRGGGSRRGDLHLAPRRRHRGLHDAVPQPLETGRRAVNAITAARPHDKGDDMSRIYEIMYLLDNNAVRAGWNEAKAAATGLITKHGGKVLSARRWDERKLAYSIKQRRR